MYVTITLKLNGSDLVLLFDVIEMLLRDEWKEKVKWKTHTHTSWEIETKERVKLFQS